VPASAWAAADEVFRAALELGGTLTGQYGVGIIKRPGAPARDSELRRAFSIRPAAPCPGGLVSWRFGQRPRGQTRL
jgi:hypothetical protein